MLFNSCNLQEELLFERRKFVNDNQLLDSVYSILNKNELDRDEIKSKLNTESSTKSNQFDINLLKTESIFHIDQIKKVSVDYRLRFLNSNLFKNEIPEEAISEIRFLEKNHNTKLDGFKIMAPSNAFNLKKYDDPLLFAPIGNDYYYLIHKWGNDLSWYRKLLVLPFKNIISFTIFCLFVSALFTYLTPSTQLSKTISFAPFIIFLFMFKSVVCTIAYYFFMMGKNFSNVTWNRQFKEN